MWELSINGLVDYLNRPRQTPSRIARFRARAAWAARHPDIAKSIEELRDEIRVATAEAAKKTCAQCGGPCPIASGRLFCQACSSLRRSLSQKKFQQTLKGKRGSYLAEWRKANRDRIKAYDLAHPRGGHHRRPQIRAAYRALPQAERNKIAALYRHSRTANRIKCYLCGKLIPKGQRHVDHVTPVALGGRHLRTNLDVACATCNQAKAAKPPSEFGLLPFGDALVFTRRRQWTTNHHDQVARSIRRMTKQYTRSPNGHQ